MTEQDTPGWEPAADANDWELIVEQRARRARGELAAVEGRPGFEREVAGAHAALAVVDTVLRTRTPWYRALPAWWSGWRIERTWRALHEAEVYTTAIDPELPARLPALRERVALCLTEGDQRRQALDRLVPQDPPSAHDRAIVTDTVRAAFDASDEAHAAARALRNKLVVAGLVLVALNTIVGMIGLIRPNLLPLCTLPIESGQRTVCAGGGPEPGPADVWLVQMLGAVGATIAAVVLLITRRPSLSPYILAGYQALIKVLLGALLAVIGTLALGAGVAEGLVCMRTQAALLLWAVVLGYSQQLGTRLLDNYADRLLNRVRPIS